MKLTVHRLPLGELTEEGAYYPKIDGVIVGEDGRCFWETPEEAKQAGRSELAALWEAVR